MKLTYIFFQKHLLYSPNLANIILFLLNNIDAFINYYVRNHLETDKFFLIYKKLTYLVTTKHRFYSIYRQFGLVSENNNSFIHSIAFFM